MTAETRDVSEGSLRIADAVWGVLAMAAALGVHTLIVRVGGRTFILDSNLQLNVRPGLSDLGWWVPGRFLANLVIAALAGWVIGRIVGANVRNRAAVIAATAAVAYSLLWVFLFELHLLLVPQPPGGYITRGFFVTGGGWPRWTSVAFDLLNLAAIAVAGWYAGRLARRTA